MSIDYFALFMKWAKKRKAKGSSNVPLPRDIHETDRIQ